MTDKRARPPPAQCEGMKGSFSNAPLISLRATFVQPVGEKRNGIDGQQVEGDQGVLIGHRAPIGENASEPFRPSW